MAVLGLGVLCGVWVLVQRWVSRHDPEQPGVEGKCGSCGVACDEDDRLPSPHGRG